MSELTYECLCMNEFVNAPVMTLLTVSKVPNRKNKVYWIGLNWIIYFTWLRFMYQQYWEVGWQQIEKL